MGSKEIGRQLAGSSITPDFKMGVTSAIFQTLAKTMDEKELFIIWVTAGSMADKPSFRTLAEILSYSGLCLKENV